VLGRPAVENRCRHDGDSPKARPPPRRPPIAATTTATRATAQPSSVDVPTPSSVAGTTWSPTIEPSNCPATAARPNSRTPVHDTSTAATVMTTIPMTPPRYSTGSSGNAAGAVAPNATSDTSHATTSAVVPAVKFTNAAV